MLIALPTTIFRAVIVFVAAETIGQARWCWFASHGARQLKAPVGRPLHGLHSSEQDGRAYWALGSPVKGVMVSRQTWNLEPFYALGNASLATAATTLDGFVTTVTNHMRKKGLGPQAKTGRPALAFLADGARGGAFGGAAALRGLFTATAIEELPVWKGERTPAAFCTGFCCVETAMAMTNNTGDDGDCEPREAGGRHSGNPRHDEEPGFVPTSSSIMRGRTAEMSVQNIEMRSPMERWQTRHLRLDERYETLQ
ncbi:hypothetical protein MAPG_07106 [Magnaporthiopsis poae ATCC 64411]|uniref:Uncharacterized protein n=1 Tax=Magnaporthiopsis poae (strain ATCC 64411 / 73-15) TaxID=644358 RepID=A0A0C4E3T5_MAGP6|nr:hypothetical protein MAPG_07106 [Magnaporthiopsis poae ATCC 64411]